MNIILNSESNLSIYEQIIKSIKNSIVKEEIIPGDMLPSIRSLARDLGISVITTKRAYEELENEDLIYSVQGKGFYVKEPNKEKLKEQQLKSFEIMAEKLIEEGRDLGLTLDDMQDVLRTLYEGGK
ncbi:GntR family transcriptional regulator [uncultured Clostridium sp.]|uniref:GntR family transcriptional regulator n=1 Tax=uncultured Clostridium sp. TaxID=59620 RepID=UPI0025F24C85|nr:GntR family transcriptional regulator [uncultured Clostridium sp.]MDU4884943.1 GntR family transcriptional regulator [Clostridium celatum]MDU7075661.1 GntR family transcriptional regulator [Clostridium celatum]